jgi:hypothetical protein
MGSSSPKQPEGFENLFGWGDQMGSKIVQQGEPQKSQTLAVWGVARPMGESLNEVKDRTGCPRMNYGRSWN